MKEILITWAFSQELNPIKKEIKKLNLRDIKFSYLSTWKGNYNMILNLTRFLEQEEDFDFIINIWVCWYKESKIDLLQVWRIKNLSNKKEIIIPHIIDFWKIESILSSENVIYNSDQLEDEKYVDMESYGFEKVCDSFNIPRIILKVPVDKVGGETKKFDFQKAERYLSENIDYKDLFKKIIDYLDKHKIKNKDLSKYNNYFNFSFTQKVIFEKLFNKFEVLTWDDFEEYFYKYIRGLEEMENSKLEAKKFLENLERFLEGK